MLFYAILIFRWFVGIKAFSLDGSLLGFVTYQHMVYINKYYIVRAATCQTDAQGPDPLRLSRDRLIRNSQATRPVMRREK